MEFLISAFAFLIIFSLVILIHEFGHFYAARKAGIKVEEFGIGLPPRIWGKKIKGTIYSVNWIPFGGFVRLYGESGYDPKLLKSKKSFVGKPLRKRMAVIVAGVFMNFMLAFALLTVGFTVGIEPLLVTPDDVLSAIDKNTIEIDHGAKVKNVEEGSPAYDSGLREGDIILSVNGERIYDPYTQLSVLEEKPGAEDIELEVIHNSERKYIEIDSRRDLENYGVDVYDVIYLPRVSVRDVKDGSDSDNAGIKKGDVIIKMNGQNIYTISDYQEIINRENVINYILVRDYREIERTVEFDENKRVIISEVLPDTPASVSGFLKGDIILSIEGVEVNSPNKAIEITKNNTDKELDYIIKRDSEEISLSVTPAENGLIGVGLSSYVSYNNSQLSVYNVDFPTSITNINDIKLPFLSSMGRAINETGRLSLLTVSMLGELVESVVSQFAIPDDVAGPVGIARLTHVFTQQGLMALLRFTALLSLSLAVINIIPFPALDGGRLLFLLIEAVRGKRIPQKWESFIHALGYLILIGLIILITYSDVLNIFS
jgi:regulator of sigma E protease